MNLKIFSGFGAILIEVALALAPLLLFFFFFQALFLRLPGPKVAEILKGMALTFAGLALFLQGVHVGFFPAGEALGRALGAMPHPWLLVPIGFVLGFVATFAEPAVRILNLEVEKVSSGYIPSQIMLYTLSLGVAVALALAMTRMLLGIPLAWFIVPGYLAALLLIRFSSRTFTAIAFDSGGVATGPMTVTFIMAIALGAASVLEGRNPLLDGFGMIALVALAPILSVLILGLLYARSERKGKSP